MNDERIDQALKTLSSAEAPECLEQRVLRRLETQRVEAPQGRRWLIPACALGACAVVALVVGIRFHRASPVPLVPAAANALPSQDLARSGALIASRRSIPLRRPHLVMKPTVEASYPAPPAPLTEQERLLVKLAQVRQRQATQAIEIAAVNLRTKDAEAALTHEEQLLVAVSRVRQDAVIDALDPVRRAAADAREKQEFNAYVRQKDGGS